MPRWLELSAEIDYWHWIIKCMYDDLLKRAPITRMIDEATGYDKAQLKEFNKIVARVKKLKEEFEKIKKAH